GTISGTPTRREHCRGRDGEVVNTGKTRIGIEKITRLSLDEELIANGAILGRVGALDSGAAIFARLGLGSTHKCDAITIGKSFQAVCQNCRRARVNPAL